MNPVSSSEQVSAAETECAEQDRSLGARNEKPGLKEKLGHDIQLHEERTNKGTNEILS
jgi:hypothetical protein